MSETKFTKGEWKELNGDGTQMELIITTNERWNNSQGVICEMDVIFDGDYGIEQAANAHLIAAAPEMYEAMQELVDRVERGEVRSVKTYHKFKAILKKARGGQAG